MVGDHGDALEERGQGIPEAYRDGVLTHIIPDDGLRHRDIVGRPQDQAEAVLFDRDAAVHGGGADDAEIQILSAEDKAVHGQGLERQGTRIGGIEQLSPVIVEA